MALELPLTLNHTRVSINLTTLYHALLKAWLLAWPLAFPGGMLVLRHCTADPRGPGLVARLRVLLQRICEYWYWQPPTPSSLHQTYRTREDEDEYWRASARALAVLRASDANADEEEVPLVRYYTPKLLPTYRERVDEDPEAREVYLAPKAFCKWHRMVFPGPMHPTLKEAQEQIKFYSSRDRGEIRRISRLAGDEQVFRESCKDGKSKRQKAPWTPRYARMWTDWLNRKGPDVAVVFE